MGIILTLFRRCKPKALLFAFVCVYIVGIVISNYESMGLFAIDENGMDTPNKLRCGQIIYSSLNYISSSLFFLSYFILGYCIAVMGIIENLKKYSILRNVLILFIINVVCITMAWLIKDASSLSFLKSLIKALLDFFGSFFYIILFLYIYYSCNYMTALFKYLESYGKLGLTNYIFQSVFGVIITLSVIIPFKISFEYALVIYLLIYVFQLWFSIHWLKTFKNGPLEWIWRCLTNMRFSNPLIDKK